MKSIKGNYIWWSAVQLAAGILIALLSIFLKAEFLVILGVSLPAVAVFNVWFYYGRKEDEREKHLLLKVYSRSGTFVLVTLTYILLSSKVDFNFILHVLWSLAFISRGGFGLFYFIRE